MVSGTSFAVKPDGLGIRHFQYLLLFIGITIAFGMRTIMNVAVVAMVPENADESHSYPTYPDWKNMKNTILSSFFWGYIVLQIPAGQIAKNYGPRWFLSCAICTASILCAVTPALAKYVGVYGVIASRVLQGLAQGFLFPSCHNLMSRWTVPLERAKWGAIVYAAVALGNVIAMPITGIICASSYGWPVVFYIYGIAGVIWSGFYAYFGASTPSEYRSISAVEKKWLEAEQDSDEGSKIATPWRAIMTSPPFLAILFSHIGQSWGFYTLLTEIPSYMANILNFDIKKNSFLSALPYVVMFLITNLISPFADYFIRKEMTSIGTSRKIFNTIGLFTPSICLITLSVVGAKDKNFVIFILVMAVGINGFQNCGYNINLIDLAPMHAGTLMGIVNSVANIASIFAPLSVDIVEALFGYKETDVVLWNIIFCLAAGILLFVGTLYIILGSGEIQPWNNLSDTDYKDSERPKKSIPIVALDPPHRISVGWIQ